MSLYYLQKFLYELNRDEALKNRFIAEPLEALSNFELTDEELAAILKPDIGLLYVLGVNGQILMHFAAFSGIAWTDYLQRMRDGITQHGPVRAGIYAMTTGAHEKVAGV